MDKARFVGWDAYEDSVVDVDLGHRLVTLGREGVLAGGPWTGSEPLHVITAYNPGRSASEEENVAAQRDLEGTLAARGVAFYAAIGRSRDSSWRETSVAILGLSDSEAIAIGRTFGQDAIFSWNGESLRVMACGQREK